MKHRVSRIRESKATTCIGCDDRVPVRWDAMRRCTKCQTLFCRLCLDENQKPDKAVCVECGGPVPPDRAKYHLRTRWNNDLLMQLGELRAP